ncbi:MAG: hypothetical protein HS113_13295 [Verrucomicrobiales bacterium]|nr:hypothetical protein [Verrucomicrobiales bacterium]
MVVRRQLVPELTLVNSMPASPTTTKVPPTKNTRFRLKSFAGAYSRSSIGAGGDVFILTDGDEGAVAESHSAQRQLVKDSR